MRARKNDRRPIVISDVLRELQAIAEVAERCDEPSVVAACRRAQSLLVRLRNQFVFDVAGPGSPSDVSIVPSDVSIVDAA